MWAKCRSKGLEAGICFLELGDGEEEREVKDLKAHLLFMEMPKSLELSSPLSIASLSPHLSLSFSFFQPEPPFLCRIFF